MLKILNKNDENNSIVLEIYGDIERSEKWTDTDVVPKAINDELKKHPNATITLNINSNGGDVFGGLAIANMLQSHKGKTIANVQGLAASISSVIAFSCDELKVPKNAYVMVHKPYAFTGGNSEDLRKTADLLDKTQDTITNIYLTKALETTTKEDITNMIDAETWLTGEELAKYFNVDVTNSLNIVNCVSDLKHSKQPQEINKKQQLSNELQNIINDLKQL